MQYRDSYSFAPGLTPAVRFLLIGTTAAYLLQALADRLTGGAFTELFSLSLGGLLRLELWQPLTYLFLHGGLWHLILNMLGLFFFGPETERTIGARRFLALYFACGILAGLGWILISGSSMLPCVGASGAIFGVLGAFAGLFPQRQVTLLVFFVIPVSLRARTLAIALGLFSLLAIVSQPGQIAYAAHLVGGLAGYLYGRYGVNQGFDFRAFNPRRWWNDLRWRWQRRKFKVLRESDRDWESGTEEPPSSQEVDEVLAKISKWGLGRLTPRDRDILDRASRRR
ncbi:MAG: rhomboid family intramembrane serine protease [Kiritimatiellae bacterium]|nr:rhomboid family intramembrane serine protease [Kiritimatiellia bacterium]